MSLKFHLIVACVALAMIIGCAGPLSQLTSTRSQGVDKIPTNVTIYPLLSTPVASMSHGGEVYSSSYLKGLGIQEINENAVISPPTESEMMITKESRMMTDFLSINLSSHGFSISELPVEIQSETGNISHHTGNDKFFVSLGLLRQMRDAKDLQAIIIGDVFFANRRSNYGIEPEKRVVFAHLKIVDVTTLDILGQISLPYDESGVEMNKATKRLAAEFAKMAALPTN
jgi:hypothetical protein